MVVAITGFGRSFVELGLGTVTVQKGELTHDEASALFWVNFGVGIALVAAMASLSPVVAWFYGDRRLLNICLLLSSVFLWTGLTVQHRSLLERQMQFGYMGAAYVLSALVGVVVAIGLAMRGFGAWALVWREIVSAASYAAGCWLFCGWRPGRPRLNVDVRSSLRFGADLSGVSIIQYLTTSADRILIGRFWGPTPLGLYTRASALATMPVEHIRMTILGVGLSPLSALHDDPRRYRQFYGALLSAMSSLSMPVVVFLVVESEAVVRILLGDRWLGAAPLLRILAVAGFANPLLSTFQLVLVSSGRSRRYLHWGVINTTCVVGAYIVGVSWGAAGVACAYAAATYALLLWSSWYCLQDTPIDRLLVIRSIVPALIASLTAGVIVIIFRLYSYSSGTLSGAILSMAVITVVYPGILLCFPAERRALAQFISYSITLLKRDPNRSAQVV